MKINKTIRVLIILGLLVTGISCDRISKELVRQNIRYNEQIRLLDNYITLTKVENKGAFLSMGNALPESIRLIFLMILPMVVLGFALIYLFTVKDLPLVRIIGICLMIAGGIGNIFDRLVYGTVTDFLHIDFVIFQTGIFNLADFSIMTGMFIILIESYLNKQKHKAIKEKN